MATKFNIKDRWFNLLKKLPGGNKILVNNVKVSPPHRISQDIANWRTAIKLAEGYSQQRKTLYDLYKDLLLDGYLNAVVQRRIDRVTNQQWVFCLPDGTEVEDVTKLAETSYFEDLLLHTIEQKFWGHSLMELLWPAPGSEDKGMTILIPRKNVKPRWEIVTKEEFGMEGVMYTRAPFKNKVIEVGKPEDLGLFMAVAQYVIYKRGNFGDWAEFAEIFGIPFRWATYNNEQSRAVLEEAMEKAGPAGYVVAPEDAKLDFINGDVTGNGSSVFRFLREACNQEIGLAILGNTMTSIESKAGGYAQSETQADAEDDLTKADIRFVKRILNEQLVPYLRRLGYPVEDGYWKLKEESEALSLKDKIDVDLKVSQKVPVGMSYWYETYGIPKPEPGDLPVSPSEGGQKGEEGNDPPDGDDPDLSPSGGGQRGRTEDDPEEGTNLNLSTQKKKGSVKRSRTELLTDYYHHTSCQCPDCIELADLPEANFKRLPANMERALAKQVRQGNYNLNPELHRQYYNRLRKFARSGFARSLGEADDWADFELQQGMLRNISEFAAAKQHSLIEELRNAYQANPTDYDRVSKGIIGRYNRQYLQTELITLETAANSAGQWQDFLDRQDIYPNLTFSTVGDDRVRPGHAAIDGATYPVGDPFWDTHTPPLDWRCRCVLLQTDDPPNELAGPMDIRKGFGANPYKSKRLMQLDHPYFQMPQNDLDDLLQLADDLRADIERPGVVRSATNATAEWRGNPVRITTGNLQSILNSDTEHTALRNAILTALNIALQEAAAIGSEISGVQTLQVTLLGRTFNIVLELDGADTWNVTEIYAV